MPRKRMIDPKFWTDDKIIKISLPARLLFISMWNYSDDLGVHRNDNFTLKAETFPLDDISVEEVDKYKNELIECGLVISYTDVRDGELLFIKNWYKYQYIKKPTPSKYKLPIEIIKNFNDDELSKYKLREIDDGFRSSTELLPPNRKERNGKEINRNEKNVKELLKDDKNENIGTNSFKRLQQELPSYKKN